MNRSEPQIIAMGGGGFLMEPDNLALDRYILAQARSSTPSVGFIATASGDSDSYLLRFYMAFSQLPCRPSHLPLFRRTPVLRDYLLRHDVLYIGGGNTRSMLAVWREWSIPELLREAWESGVVLAGVSAGAICWFDMGITDSSADKLAPMSCLGFLSGTLCPHYDGEAERRPALHRLIADGSVPAALALDDGAAAHFRGTQLTRVATSRPSAKAYRVELIDGVVNESP